MSSSAETLTFAQALRDARAKAGLTQEKAARELGVTLSTYQDWEGDRHQPRLAEFTRVCRLYGWPLPFGDRVTGA